MISSRSKLQIHKKDEDFATQLCRHLNMAMIGQDYSQNISPK
jgi:hypothetical protein